MSKDLLRVALYARVSSDRQAKAATIDSQVAALAERICEDGHRLEDELCFLDDGYSGGTLLRPGLEQLRDVAYAGAIDVLYVHSPDRLARKYAYQVLLIDELKKAGVQVVFLNHALGDSPEDELLLQVQGVVAEYERAKILERGRRGKRHAARRGDVSVLSGAPYGFRYVSKQAAGGLAQYEVVAEEAKLVRQIFEWVGREGASLGEVRRRLHQQGTKTRTGKDWWDRNTIWQMLKNPAYHGAAAYGKQRVGERRAQLRPQRGQAEQPRLTYSVYSTSPAEQESIPVPAIVSQALFETVAEQLAENQKHQRQRRAGAKYLLQGLVVCGCCGYSYYGKPIGRSLAKKMKRHYAYYRCLGSDGYRYGGQRQCDNKQVRTDLLEAAVWEDVAALLSDPDRVRGEYERRLAGGEENNSLALVQTESSIHKLGRAIARLIDAYEEGLLSKEEFEPRVRQNKARLSALQTEHAKLSAQATQDAEFRSIVSHLEEFSKHVTNGLENLDWQSQREVIRALVKRVEIGKEEVRVIYKIGPPPFVPGPASGAVSQDCPWRLGSKTREVKAFLVMQFISS